VLVCEQQKICRLLRRRLVDPTPLARQCQWRGVGEIRARRLKRQLRLAVWLRRKKTLMWLRGGTREIWLVSM